MISAAPQGFTPVGQVVNSRTGEVIDIDAENLDINGCLVGPSGEKGDLNIDNKLCQSAIFPQFVPLEPSGATARVESCTGETKAPARRAPMVTRGL